jgi:hypothetical protein
MPSLAAFVSSPNSASRIRVLRATALPLSWRVDEVAPADVVACCDCLAEYVREGSEVVALTVLAFATTDGPADRVVEEPSDRVIGQPTDCRAHGGSVGRKLAAQGEDYPLGLCACPNQVVVPSETSTPPGNVGRPGATVRSTPRRVG